ncbi:MAG: exo-alpha-sialidase [Candidatus Hydrogenedentes bacterium]|nr:exo-alpha-sialidase [Candidatus Hydrogenedentota bacterium]
MAGIRLLDTGLVYRNPVPNVRSRHAYFPSTVELPNRELVVTMDVGSAMEALDVRSYVCRSHDGGRTWTEPTIIFEPDLKTTPSSTTCRSCGLADGSLLGLMTFFDRSRSNEGLANPATEGFVRTEFSLVKSHDGGRTWSAPRICRLPLEWHSFESCSPIVCLDDRRWLLPTSLWRGWEGRCPYGMRAVAFTSDDSGATWTGSSEVMNLWSRETACWEQKQALLSTGHLFAICWAYDYRARKSLRNHYAISNNRGESFEPPRESPLCGETCSPLALTGNRVLFVYRRTDERGLWAHLAEISGDTWTPLEDAALWGSKVVSYTQRSETSMFEELSTLQFGYPQLTRLSTGEIFIVFWCVEDCVSNIRWLKLEVEDLA